MTSFASPLVACAASLVKSVQPSWGPDEIYEALLGSTHKTEGQNETVYKNLFGAGLLQVDKAITFAKEILDGGEVDENKTSTNTVVADSSNQKSRSSFLYLPTTGQTSQRKFAQKENTYFGRLGLRHVETAATIGAGDQRFSRGGGAGRP